MKVCKYLFSKEPYDIIIILLLVLQTIRSKQILTNITPTSTTSTTTTTAITKTTNKASSSSQNRPVIHNLHVYDKIITKIRSVTKDLKKVSYNLKMQEFRKSINEKIHYM